MKINHLLIFLSIAGGVAFGQTAAGTLTGRVTDQTGAVIAGMPVVATNLDTGARIAGATSQTGNYTIPQMPVGKYEVTLERTGFKTFRESNMTLDAAQTVRLDVVMELGSTTDAVTVTGETTLLQEDSGATVRTILTKQIQDLPVIPPGTFVRDPLALALTLPGSVSGGAGFASRINGLPSGSNQYRIDGEVITNAGFATITVRTNVSPDAIQEVAIQSSNFNAEFGSVSGAVFNQVIKSGTNQYHGTAYDYFANDKLNSADAASHVKNRIRGNDWGVNIGGPVRIPKLYNGKDKTFFFANFEQYLQYQLHLSDFTVPTVPTSAYRSGDFGGLLTASGVGGNPVNLKINGTTGVRDYKDPLGNSVQVGAIFDPLTTTTAICNTALSLDCGANGSVVTVRTAFPGNKIPLSRIDKVSAAILSKYVPLPQGPNAALGILTGNYFNPFKGNRITRSPTLKLDQNVGSKARVSFTYSDNHTENAVQANGLGEGFPEPITGNGGTFENSPTFRLNMDYTLRPTTILHVGIGFSEFNFCNCAVTTNYNAATAIGLTGATLNQTFPRMNTTVVAAPQLGGLSTLGPPGQSVLPERHPTSSASITTVRGNHTYKFGGDYRKDLLVTLSTANTAGTFSFGTGTAGVQTGNGVTWQPSLDGLTGFSGNTNVGFPFANWLLGSVTSLTLGQPADYRQSKSQAGLYAQDTWRIRRNLTIDLGLRWDYGTYSKEQFGRAVDFSATTPNPSADGRPGAYIYEATCKCSFAHNYPYAYAPRLGVAYTLDKKTVIRGGFGIAYGFTAPSAGRIINSAITPTLQNGLDDFQLQGGIPSKYQPVWPNFNAGFGFVPNTVNTTQASLIDPNAGRPDRTYQWNIALQREITRDLVLEASYIGNRNIWQNTGGFQDLNAISEAILKKNGFTVGNLDDATLLSTQWNRLSAAQSATLKARGVVPPYPSFPVSGPFASTVLQALKPFPQFSSVIAPTAPQGKSWYDSLQLQVTKRVTHGLSANVNYTFSKNLQFISSPDIFNNNVGKDLVGANPPQVLRITFDYTTPYPKNIPVLGNKFISQIVGGWGIAGAMYYQTGAYMGRPTSGSTNAVSRWLGRGPGSAQLNKNADGSYMNPWSVDWTDLSGTHHTDPIDINCHCFDPSKTTVLNPAAWQAIPDATWTGDTSTYAFFRAPRRPSENANLARNFRIKERYTLQIRAEFQNVFNRNFLPAPAIAFSPINTASTLQKASNGNYIGGFGTFGNLGNSAALGTQRVGQLVARFTF